MAKPTSFSERLAQLRREKAAREFRDVDQEEIARAIGLSPKQQPYISKWENDTTPKDTAIVKRLAEFYGVNWLWLLHGEEGADRQAQIVELPAITAQPIKPAEVARRVAEQHAQVYGAPKKRKRAK